jgi:hypothetical protein
VIRRLIGWALRQFAPTPDPERKPAIFVERLTVDPERRTSFRSGDFPITWEQSPTEGAHFEPTRRPVRPEHVAMIDEWRRRWIDADPERKP